LAGRSVLIKGKGRKKELDKAPLQFPLWTKIVEENVGNPAQPCRGAVEGKRKSVSSRLPKQKPRKESSLPNRVAGAMAAVSIYVKGKGRPGEEK